jgi:hypothetical protein
LVPDGKPLPGICQRETGRLTAAVMTNLSAAAIAPQLLTGDLTLQLYQHTVNLHWEADVGLGLGARTRATPAPPPLLDKVVGGTSAPLPELGYGLLGPSTQSSRLTPPVGLLAG